jgi:hypothetical protein
MLLHGRELETWVRLVTSHPQSKEQSPMLNSAFVTPI